MKNVGFVSTNDLCISGLGSQKRPSTSGLVLGNSLLASTSQLAMQPRATKAAVTKSTTRLVTTPSATALARPTTSVTTEPAEDTISALVARRPSVSTSRPKKADKGEEQGSKVEMTKTKWTSMAQMSSSSLYSTTSTGSKTYDIQIRARSNSQQRTEEFVKNRKRAELIDYNARYVPPGRRMPARPAVKRTASQPVIDEAAMRAEALAYSIAQATIAAAELIGALPTTATAPMDASEQIMLRADYMRDVGELEARFQKMHFDDDVFLAKLQNPEKSVANYAWTAYHYFTENRKPLMTLPILKLLRNIISAPVDDEMKREQIQQILRTLPKNDFTAIKASIGHLFRCSRLTVLPCVNALSTLFSGLFLPIETAETALLNQRDMTIRLYIEQSCLTEGDSVLSFLIDHFMPCFLSNDEAIEWRHRMASLQHHGGSSMGLTSEEAGWRQLLASDPSK